MTDRVDLLPAAEDDIEAAAVWYASERVNLGLAFLERVDRYPSGSAARFPYGVFFRLETTRIVVVAVLHLHRHDGTWRDRA